MAFYPLFKNITEEVNTLNSHANELYQTVIKSESEQSAVAASKQEGSVCNSHQKRNL